MGIKGHPHQGEYPYQLHYDRDRIAQIEAHAKILEDCRAIGPDAKSDMLADDLRYLLGEVARLQAAIRDLPYADEYDQMQRDLTAAKAEVARLAAERDAAVDEFREARNTSYLERAERAEAQLAPLREALEQAAVNLQALGTIRESTITPTDFRTIATSYANRARSALSGVQETQTKTTKND